MSQPSSEDILAPFDPSAYPSISGPQLLQLINGVTPYLDKGLCMVTVDIATVPQVPAANTTTKWQTYLWIRISISGVTVYAWNPNAASDATFLQWQSINISSIGAGVIVNSMIADNTIQDSKIVSLSYGKLTGAPSGIAPTGNASGDLTGTYPGPTIAPLAVTGAKLALATVAEANLIPASISNATLKGDGSQGDMTRTATSTGLVEWFAPCKTLVASVALETNLAANPGKVVRANIAGTGYEYGHALLQTTIDEQTGIFNTNQTLAVTGTAPTTANTAICTLFGAAGVVAFTPLSAVSTIVIDVRLQLSTSTNNTLIAVLFEGTTALAAALVNPTGANAMNSISFIHKLVSTGVIARNFSVRLAASSGAINVNSSGATATLGGGLTSSCIKIDEII